MKTILNQVILFFLITLSFYNTLGAPETMTQSKDEFAMSGLHLKDYPEFAKNWQMVTVRYRKDTGELRFIYANPIAWKALLGRARDYPDGSVFAKIGFATHNDPAFTSSVVPNSEGARRYQFMLRNKTLYRDTDGWGYALFDAQGRTFPENKVNQVQACAACHRIVPERGQVFAEPLQLAPFQETADSMKSSTLSTKISFRSEDAKHLPEIVRMHLNPETETVSLVQGDLAKHLFQGTLDEIRPSLAEEVSHSKRPAILLSLDKTRFSLVVQDSGSGICKKSGVHGVDLKAVHSLIGEKNPIYQLSFCHEEPQPVSQ